MRRQQRGSEKDHAKWIAERVRPSLAAILTRSARESALIFCILGLDAL
jgi:hypothetical protein